MTAKRTMKADRERWERKFHSAGGAILAVRMSPSAMSALSSMCEEFQCNRRDVIEGLLLGTIRQSSAHTRIERNMRRFDATRSEAALMLGGCNVRHK